MRCRSTVVSVRCATSPYTRVRAHACRRSVSLDSPLPSPSCPSLLRTRCLAPFALLLSPTLVRQQLLRCSLSRQWCNTQEWSDDHRDDRTAAAILPTLAFLRDALSVTSFPPVHALYLQSLPSTHYSSLSHLFLRVLFSARLLPFAHCHGALQTPPFNSPPVVLTLINPHR